MTEIPNKQPVLQAGELEISMVWGTVSTFENYRHDVLYPVSHQNLKKQVEVLACKNEKTEPVN